MQTNSASGSNPQLQTYALACTRAIRRPSACRCKREACEGEWNFSARSLVDDGLHTGRVAVGACAEQLQLTLPAPAQLAPAALVTQKPVWFWELFTSIPALCIGSFVAVAMPWWLIAGRSFVRWSTAAMVMLLILLLNAQHSVWSLTLRTLGTEGLFGVALLDLATFSAFIVQLLPAIIIPMLLAAVTSFRRGGGR